MGKKRRRRLRPRWEVQVLNRIDAERKEAVCLLLARREGYTFADLVDATGLEPGVLRRLIRRYKAEGKLGSATSQQRPETSGPPSG